MLIVWDEPKRETNLKAPPDGHGLDFADARDRFVLEEAVIVPSYPGPEGQARFMALGPLDDRLVAFVFSPLGSEAVSLISLRQASRKERRIYDQAQAATDL